MLTGDSRKKPELSSPARNRDAPGGLSAAGAALHQRIAQRQATVAVVGLGYVGLPLAAAMHAAGFRVLGFDTDPHKIELLSRGESYLKHLGPELVTRLCADGRFRATADETALGAADAILLCVPTPLGRHHEPDMSFVENSTRMVARQLRAGQLVVLESTTYPGTTRGLCLPLLEQGGLRCGQEFFLAFSPEREDPGRKDYDTQTIPKLVGGVDPASAQLAVELYAAAVRQVVPVENAEIAETAKLLENIYRAVNIALVNELKPVLRDMGIDIWKVVEAAATKPFGFQPFYPGPGLGGHCIPIDPFYLTWRAREFGHHTRFIELAGEINSAMPRQVVARAYEGLNRMGKPVRGARVLVVGVAYKADIDDTRETPAAPIISQLQEAGAEVLYHDPHVPRFPRKRAYDIRMDSVPLDAGRLRAMDAVLILVRHRAVDWQLIAREAPLVVDACNAMAPFAPIKGLLVPA
ncbi:MAG TPA: nucleotide sugar dehydrogenase [Nevskiales bacterium]|nr:nucleotide sugar dehydrogenase [Nevskiales bacterium]